MLQDTSRFERPSNVQELNGELYVKGAKKDAVKQIKVDPPSGLNVAFDGASTVTLNWSGPSSNVDAYAASYKATDGSSGSLSVSGTTATLGGIKPGVTYSFSVVAKKGTGTSPAVGASFTAPGGTPDAKKADGREEALKKTNEDKLKQEEAKKKADEDQRKQQEQQPRTKNNNVNYKNNSSNKNNNVNSKKKLKRKPLTKRLRRKLLRLEEAKRKADEEAKRKADEEARKKS